MRIMFVQRTVKLKFNTYFHKDNHISKFTSVLRYFKSNFYFRNFFSFTSTRQKFRKNNI